MPVKRPNIVIVLADDMGFSDIGCYGGEIKTPNLDSLGRRGVRLSQFYNTARCSPSRASLLTGLHPHQTGIGILTNDNSPRGYPGTINRRCATLAETLGHAGYATCLSGKWHLAVDMKSPNDCWPTRRGFDRFFGTLAGCGSFYKPGTLKRQEEDASSEAEDPSFFYTDAIANEGAKFIRDQASTRRPFFLYAAFTAPHWPLHAPPEDIEACNGRYEEGWDSLREKRMARLIREGVLPADTTMSGRDPTQPHWDDVPNKAWETRRMQVYAAQVERMDKGIGRILEALKETDALDDTLFIFLSDNGASAEADLERLAHRTDICPPATRDGRTVRVGNSPEILPGSEDTYASYGQAWANLSNTPFRFYKRWTHEGGIATPLIAHWPNGTLKNGHVVDLPCQLVDIVPTILDAVGASYPPSNLPEPVLPLEGRSVLPALRGEEMDPRPLFWEHVGNAAIRTGHWKLVREQSKDWELYDLKEDRCELRDLAKQHPEIVADLATRWSEWAVRVGVIPWEVTLSIYAERGLGPVAAAG